jgi:uncharacterized membrane protein (DUF373 family)
VWFLVVVGALFALREVVEGGTMIDFATLATIAISLVLIAYGWYWIVSNPKGPTDLTR